MATDEGRTLPWRTLAAAVLTRQRRIDNASHASDGRRGHRLQRLRLTSRAAKRLAVRRVTPDNQGKHTAGIDGVKSLPPPQRLARAERLGTRPTGHPTRRVWIPKPGKTEQRPLGLPTRHDRARHALVKLVMDPEWEAPFEPNRDGFRPGRSVHEAIGAIFIAIDKPPTYGLDGEIAKGVDRLDHQALLRKMGTPQGAVASPLVAPIAWHGLDTHRRAQFPGQARCGQAGERVQVRWNPQVIRDGDDVVVLHRDNAVIEPCQRLADEWRRGRGLERHRDQTRMAHTLEHEVGQAGFNVLGFEVRHHPVSRDNAKRGFKTRIKPTQEAIKRHEAQLSTIIRALVSQAVFQRLDHQLYLQRARWARDRHPRTSRHWIVQRDWRTDQGHGWVFATKEGLAVNRHAEVPIVRHRKVRDTASRFNGDWKSWATRRGRYPGVPRRVATLLKRQGSRCHHGGLFFTPQARLEVHHLNRDRRTNVYSKLAAVHRHGHDQIHGGSREPSSRQGTHDKSPLDRGAVCLERGTHGFADQWGERSPH